MPGFDPPIEAAVTGRQPLFAGYRCDVLVMSDSVELYGGEVSMCGGRGRFGGIVLLSLGVIFLLMNLGIVQTDLFRIWWPLLLIALGVARLVGRGRWPRPRGPYNDFGSA